MNMATGLENQDGQPENLKKQLALAVRRIQWSYSIFWSISASQPGVLEWSDGYYNGDIKTRKTVQAVELNADQMGLQRSEQLRELYESLSAGEASPQSRRPSAALSPEDLSDAEWYYLVCMSFVFNIGQGLPGRTLANDKPIWLCNAHFADSKVFSRSLLAKSASIQTVVCFPFLGGVVELGVTELVMEDPDIIQQIKTSILEIPYPIVSRNANLCAANARNDLDHDPVETKSVPVLGSDELDMASPNDNSDGFEPIQLADDSLIIEGINGGASQVQSWQFMDDDEFSNCIPHSMDSSDCISQTLLNPEKPASGPKSEMVGDHQLQDLQDCNHTRLSALDLHSNDVHYQGVLSALLKSSHQLLLGPLFQNSHQESSFISWKKGGFVKCPKPRGEISQNLVKKVLFEVPRMHAACRLESPEDNGNRDGVWRPEADEIGMNHALSERRRREKLNKRFSILKSLVPSISKDDKISILDDAIEYLKVLERKVEELEYFRESTEIEPKTKRQPQDTTERTSDNYGNNKTSSGKKPLINKRKASDIDESEQGINYGVQEDGLADNVTVSMKNNSVTIEIMCSWREGVLLEIMDALSNLHLDSHSVQSSIIDGILSLTIKSKFKGSTLASARKIKQALQRFVGSC
ncbi:transcription factor EGL1 [Ziziphus jujuba]|uniref:Transcription factor EGL1 n=1 Tax=Ziziphus jujuba TaxID=326968 RepID=A0A6P3Z0Y4_ZIZJJ|nr:transcription factor EGL1 [Ziziphus jujuba]